MTPGYGVLFWWLALCAAAVLNIIAWSISAAYLKRRRAQMPVNAYAACRMQLGLSAAYVFGCAFRSALPIFDIPRLCLFNCWISSVIVGRSVATVAELCFVAQWGLMLRATGKATGSVVTQAASRLLVPLIAMAEVCSWYSVLTTSNLGHIVEESLWALSASLFVASLIAVWPRCPRPQRTLFTVWCAAGTLYVAYMLCVDVPMYWARWIADEAHGRQYLSLVQGVMDASDRRVVSYRWTDWKSEIGWMSLYFTVAVWISLSLVHAAVVGARRSRAQLASLSSMMRS
ncbi:MAG TPA: hypothetical protein VJQ47_06565 [Steroidobacteraceae bacterium]|nr:hypothetical protein [Steroidobacteraceae bacterium]